MLDRGYVPEHTHRALLDYFNNRWEPGSFLMAVLQNDLMQASFRADHINKTKIPEIAAWIYHNAPTGSWGSYERIQGWIAKNEYQQNYEQQRLVNILAGKENV